MKLLQQLTIPQVLLLAGFFFWNPGVVAVCTFCIWVIALCVSPDIEDEGRYVCIGVCSCALLLILLLMSGTWHWFPWIAFTATLTWCFGAPIQEGANTDNIAERGLSGQMMAYTGHTKDEDEDLEWLDVTDENSTQGYKKRTLPKCRNPKRLTYTRGYLETSNKRR